MKDCPKCGGSGELKGRPEKTSCSYCGGSGYTVNADSSFKDYCYVCSGSGWVDSPFSSRIKCDRCKGTGKVYEEGKVSQPKSEPEISRYRKFRNSLYDKIILWLIRLFGVFVTYKLGLWMFQDPEFKDSSGNSVSNIIDFMFASSLCVLLPTLIISKIPYVRFLISQIVKIVIWIVVIFFGISIILSLAGITES